MITLENIHKQYGKKKAVDGLSLEIPSGEVFAMLGPNGAGKTTTIKMIAGLLRPTSGQISVCGHDVAREYLEVKKLIGYVPDQPFLYDKLTGLEFLRFLADLYGVNGARRKEEFDRVIDLFSMQEYIGGLTESYSHGMKQRLVLGATLMHRPKVIVVDEPMVGLDPHSSRLVREIFRKEAESGTTILMSTHVISIAEETARRIGIISRGKLLAVGTREELAGQAGSDESLEDIYFRITGTS